MADFGPRFPTIFPPIQPHPEFSTLCQNSRQHTLESRAIHFLYQLRAAHSTLICASERDPRVVLHNVLKHVSEPLSHPALCLSQFAVLVFLVQLIQRVRVSLLL